MRPMPRLALVLLAFGLLTLMPLAAVAAELAATPDLDVEIGAHTRLHHCRGTEATPAASEFALPPAPLISCRICAFELIPHRRRASHVYSSSDTFTPFIRGPPTAS